MPWIYVSTEWPYDRPPGEQLEEGFIIEDKIRRAEVRSRREATPHVRALLHNTFTAIREDPAPFWRDRQQVDFIRRRLLVEDADAILGDMFGSDADLSPRPTRERRRVTYFESLHWIGQHLDRICPFKK